VTTEENITFISVMELPLLPPCSWVEVMKYGNRGKCLSKLFLGLSSVHW
jgi:hypothetical protein